MSNTLPPHKTWYHVLAQQLAASRPAAWLFAPTLHHVDRWALWLSGNRTTLTAALAGLPIVWLTSTGARSGQPRTVPLVGIPDGAKVVLIATNFGQKSHPAWYHNLRANPQATLRIGDRTASYVARLADEAECARYWPIADAIYPGFRQYRQRISGRPIGVFVLEPEAKAPAR